MCHFQRHHNFVFSFVPFLFVFLVARGNVYVNIRNITDSTSDGIRDGAVNDSSNSRSFVPIFLSDSIVFSKSNFTLNSPDDRNYVSIKTQVPSTKQVNVDDGGEHQHYTTGGGSYNVVELVKNLDIRLKNIRNVELGVTIIQEIFDAMDFTATVRNDTQTVTRIAKRMTRKLEKAFTTISDLRNFFVYNVTLDESLRNSYVFLNTLIHPCPPFEDISLEQTYNTKQIQILNYLRNSDHYDEDDFNFTLNAKIVEEMQRISSEVKHFKHVYFLSRSDHASDHNCQYYFNDIHFRNLYVSAIKRKRIILLIDHGNAFNTEQMDLSKKFISSILGMLSSHDYVTVITVSDRVTPMDLKNYYKNNTFYSYPATMDVKAKIISFINNLNRSAEITNHTLGFEVSFEIARKQNVSGGTPIQVLYITRGLLSDLTEGLSVLKTIAQGQSLLSFPVIINTCAVVLDERRMMYEKQFLRDIAEQNYTKYNIDVSDWYDKESHEIRGTLFVVTKRHLERIIKTSTAVFESMFQEKYLSDDLEFHLPVIDYNTKDVIVSITRTVKPYGVVGVNIYLADLAEDVIYFKQSEGSYAFLMDTKGIVISHPAFPRPVATNKDPFPIDIFYLENSTDFQSIRRRLLSETVGNLTVLESNTSLITYTWERVLDVYVVCIVTKVKGNGKIPIQLSRVPSTVQKHYQHTDYFASPELLYHRIDLIPPHTPVCRHFRQIATLDSATVFLSASAFQSPFVYLKNNRENRGETGINNAQSIMAYIKDITNLLANPGLQAQVRSDVSALYHVMAYLKKKHQEAGPLRKYIIRRYVATTNGVIQVYPGCILGTNLEPSRRPWYRKAMKHSGKIVVTEPYLDAGGAGYITTIAHTIFEGKANALHNAERDVPVSIVAIDVPYAFFYKLILDSTPVCSEANIKCLLIEDEGYLLGHPSVMEPATNIRNNRRPVEHITHKESFVANDILNHKKLVRKQLCANYQNRTVQRFYTFNTSLEEVLTNVAHGERTKYQITSIRGTNLFAAILNSTCDGGAFCPCSTVDRTCLNCNRMDQTDCECPCECPLNVPYKFNERLLNSTALYDYCEPPAEVLAVVNSLSYDWSTVLKSCMSITCDVYTTHTDCLGVMGCEWCQLDVDGNFFSTPFCAAQSSCFNGVLGSMTPYGDGDIGSAIVEPSIPPAYSAIGPVGGAIIALCVVVGVAMYCYRQNLENTSDQFYADSMQEDNYGVPLSRFNFDDISPHDDSDLSGGGPMNRNLLNSVGNAIAVPDISPYHMSSGGYRRPNGESDHGYSTMTPHEDSEHMCFTLVEPLINNKRLSMSDSMSINTSVSSPTNQNQLISMDRPQTQPLSANPSTKNSPIFAPGQTFLHEQISPHHILAPVTVHRHMEAS